MSTLRYDSLSHNITIRYDLAEMPSRDKVALFHALADLFGIPQALKMAEADEAISVIDEQLNKAWMERI